MSNSITNIFSKTYLGKPVYSASLAVFRLVFGLMLFGGTVRFWLKGWIEELYVKPGFFFHYFGFDWVQPAVYLLAVRYLCTKRIDLCTWFQIPHIIDNTFYQLHLHRADRQNELPEPLLFRNPGAVPDDLVAG